MNDTLKTAVGILLPLLGTCIGAAFVFFLKKEMDIRFKNAMFGIASGVMIAASVWSLLIPAIEMAEGKGNNAWLCAAGGFLCGVGVLLILDSIIPHLHSETAIAEGKDMGRGKTVMLALAVTLHNIPEGMAIGVVFAGAMRGGSITVAGAYALAIGIAIQNIPEGAIISMPAVTEGAGRKKAFLWGFLSGAVEPFGAVITLLVTSAIEAVLPFILSFAAGAMIYVVVDELIPGSRAEGHSNIATVGVAVGFAVMMVLDVALG